MSVFTKTPTWYRAVESAAGLNFSIIPGQIYRWAGGRVPPTVAAFVSAKVLEQLDGDPGPGFQCLDLSAAAMSETPRPEPVREPLIDSAELCRRLGITFAEMKEAQVMGFFKPWGTRTSAFDENHPDKPPVTLHDWAATVQLLANRRAILQKIAAAATSAR